MDAETQRKITILRTEIAFARSDMAHGGPNRKEEIEDFLRQIDELTKSTNTD